MLTVLEIVFHDFRHKLLQRNQNCLSLQKVLKILWLRLKLLYGPPKTVVTMMGKVNALLHDMWLCNDI